MPVPCSQIRVANSGAYDANQNFIISWFINLYLFDFKRTCFLPHHSGFDFHFNPPFINPNSFDA
jgi:hypothetical protein